MATPSEQLKACAAFLTENADELVGHLFTGCTSIRVSIEISGAEWPTIEVVKNFVPVHTITVATQEGN